MDGEIPERKPKSFFDSARDVLTSTKNKIQSSLSFDSKKNDTIDINKALSPDINSYALSSKTLPIISDTKKSITNKSDTNTSSTNTSSTNTSSKLSGLIKIGTSLKNIAIYGGAFIIIIILGTNIFNYLGSLRENISYIFNKIQSYIGDNSSNKKNSIDKNSKVSGGIDKLENTINNKKTRNKIDQKKRTSYDDNEEDDDVVSTRAPTTSAPTTSAPTTSAPTTSAPTTQAPRTPKPDDANSTMQKKNSKPGYCYIGESKGLRTCTSVNNASECMSGEIFPSMEICVNPNLRA